MTDTSVEPQSTPLPAGTRAPDFELHSTPDEAVSLAQFRGRPVILAFYPADWSPVCSDQMVLYQEIMPEFERHDAALFGISVDGVWCHSAFANAGNIRFLVVSVCARKGRVSREYGDYRYGDAFGE